MASRATLTILPRRGPSTLLQTRPFSQSSVFCAGQNKKNDAPPVRQNPLVGNYQPATPEVVEAAIRDAFTSTEKPRATRTPRPDKAPVSSAEVAPNADLPPRPPPLTSRSTPSSEANSDIPPRYVYDATRRDNSAPGPKRSTSIDFLSMLDTRNSIHSQISVLDPLERPKVRAAIATGRTVFVKNFTGPNAASSAPVAINVLNKLVAQQGVRAKFNYQRFHERRGMKKKRLKMVRWRKQFKAGFRATVKRVMELKRQGW
ncbi:hypothetical protein CC79DRAFT_914588 [Sarocladium strictum]